MENEELVVQAIQKLNNILKEKKILSASILTDSDWSDGERSIEVEIKYLPKK